MLVLAIQPVIACEPDMNGDGVVDLKDLFVVAEAFGSVLGDTRWNPQADINGDGAVDVLDVAIVASHFGESTLVNVKVRICPCTLNLRSKGRWIIACIELPKGYAPDEIDASSIMLNNTVPVATKPFPIMHLDCKGKSYVIVKFDRQKVIDLIRENYQFTGKFGIVKLTITGKLRNATFLGSDTIKVVRYRLCP
jgi:hypothetical protein